MSNKPDLSIVPDLESEPSRPSGIAPELSLLVAGIDDEAQRNSVIRALFDFSRGQPDAFSVKFAVLLKALTLMVGMVPILVKKAFIKESKSLTAALIAYQTSVKESTLAVTRAVNASNEQVESLKAELWKSQQAERKAREEEASQMRRQIEELQRNIPDVRAASKLANEFSQKVFWAGIAVAVVIGASVTLLVEYLVRNLFH